MSNARNAKRFAKYKAKQEKLKREREQQQKQAEKQSMAPTDSKDSADQQREEKTSVRPKSTRAESIIAFCTISLVIVAVAQIASMLATNSNMREQIRQTDDTLALMRLGQRPWIATENARVQQPFVADGPVIFSLAMKNYGNGPATVVGFKIVSYVETIDPGSDDFAVLKKDFISKSTPVEGHAVYIPPQTAIGLFANKRLHTLKKEDIDAIQSSPPHEWLYIFGKLKYVDTWNKPHYYGFCYYWDTSTTPPSMVLHAKYSEHD